MNWIILALTFQVILGLVTIITLKIKYRFSLEMNSGATTGMEITSSKGLDWSDKKTQFFSSVYSFLLLAMPVFVMVETVVLGVSTVLPDILKL